MVNQDYFFFYEVSSGVIHSTDQLMKIYIHIKHIKLKSKKRKNEEVPVCKRKIIFQVVACTCDLKCCVNFMWTLHTTPTGEK